MPAGLTPLISLNDHPIRDAAVWPVISSGYSNSSAYRVNDHTVYADQLYRCVVAIGDSGEEWTPDHWVLTTIDEELGHSIQQGIDALHVLAREYDPTLPYSVNNYVMKDGTFYRCTTEIQNGEAWNPTHWTEVTVASELGDQRTATAQLAEEMAETVDELTDTIQEAVGLIGNVIAADYDESSAYHKDEYVIKDGVLYRALTDIPASAEWDDASWEDTTVGIELTESRTQDKFTQDSIAPEYDPTMTYGAGSLVMYGGKLYRCVTAVTTAEPWNPARWTLTSVSNEVSMTDITSVFGFYIDEDGYLAQNITADGVDPSTVNLDEVLGFYISVDGFISQKVSA